MRGEELRAIIFKSLRKQGFKIRSGRLRSAASDDKAAVRALHEHSVAHRRETARPALERLEPALLKRLASGSEVNPSKIQPVLVEVQSRSEDELLFRYACLHWSIPVSSGYGRRLRFLVLDQQNNKLIGLIGLGDPVFSMACRDSWIGWDSASRQSRLRHVMDAFVLGSVPPYSNLLCGKLVAMLATSDEVRCAFSEKYKGVASRILGTPFDGRLALVTTASALGRSSVYNRLSVSGERFMISVGYTRGSGEFHFSNGVYAAIHKYATRYCEQKWGKGFRSRREVVKKCLAKIGLSTELIYHGVEREVFCAPIALNAREFLRGETSRLVWPQRGANRLFEHFRSRWLLPRAERVPSFSEWEPHNWALWPPGPGPRPMSDLTLGLISEVA
jgi:hypothetical protein